MNRFSGVKDLKPEELPVFCGEIRTHLINSLSETGGHLASNLGVVELTVALHRVFDTEKDRIVFDVGHQCYVHKLLTGRDISGIRHFGGISGYPKPAESVHDAFIAGHASTSVSAALGMARAARLSGEDIKTVSVIGDGALTGGLAYEGLNDAGQSGLPFIVILNDNGMSISGSVGGVARYLAKLRVKPQYFRAKSFVHRMLNPLPGGQILDVIIGSGKRTVKEVLLPDTIFEHMGFIYYGVLDGHDSVTLERVMRYAVALKRPVILHIATIKGKGYFFSEKNPAGFHGVTGFQIENGRAKAAKNKTFSSVFGKALADIAEENTKICAVTAAMRSATGLDSFAKRHRERFFDVGIAEAHAVTMSAGLAKGGLKPVVCIYSTFLQRAYDQIIHDVAIQGLNVVFAIDRAGIAGEDGETHQGVFDPAFLATVPGMELWCPACFAELKEMLKEALNANGPSAIRYPRGGQGEYNCVNLGNAVLREGEDGTIVTYGIIVNEALKASEILKRAGISCGVIKIGRLLPHNREELMPLLRGRVYLLEENTGVLKLPGCSLNLDRGFIPHGTREELLESLGLNGEKLAERIENDLKA